MRVKAPTDERRVFLFILDRVTHGATDDEIEVGLDLLHQNASARRRALVLQGKIVKTEVSRLTRHRRFAAVYVAKQFESYPVS